MEVTEQDLREQYESLETEELIEMYRNNELTELASSVLTQVLRERGISPENLSKRAAEEAKEPQTFQADVSPSFLDLTHYIKQYESLETEELVEMIRKSELPEPAWSALTQILEDRGISHEALDEPVFGEEANKKPIAPMKSPQQKAEEDEFLGLLVESNPRFFITKIIVTLNILVFAVMALSGVSLFAPEIEHLLKWGANFGPLTVTQWWRLLSSTFLHIGVIHLLFNMWCLWSMGKLAERMFGTWTFLMLYVLSGLGGSIASVGWHPRIVSAGASGAIFGVAGGLITFLYLGKLQVPGSVIKKNLKSALFFVGYNVFYGLTQSGIDNAAHIGGLLVGLLIGGFLHRPLPPPKDYSHLRHYIVFSGLSLSFIVGAQFIKTQAVNDPLTKLINAEKLIESGDLDQAIAEYTEAIELDPKIAEAYNDRGIAYLKKEQFDQAISDFNNAIELKPKLAMAHNNRGIAYLKKEQFDQAISDFNNAIELKPKLAMAHNNRGLAYFYKKEYEKAWDDVQKAQNLGYQVHPEFLKQLRYTRAITDLNKAIEINPRDADAYYKRGRAHQDNNQYDQAISDFNNALDINPRLAQVYNSRGEAWHEKDNYDAAIQDYIDALEIDPRYAEAYFNRGHIKWHKFDYDGAIADYTKAIEIDPRYVEAYNKRGVAWAQKEEYEQAIVDINRALELNPRYARAYMDRGVVWSFKGDLDRALTDAKKAISLNPTNKEFQEFLAYLKSKIKDNE
jgi:tetratricopeptide (TPR) repeat protein/membrane associated rhomboid family serine protease